MKNLLPQLGALVFGTLLATPSLASPAVGQKLPAITLNGDAGGRTDGGSWSSDMIKDKAWLLFYVDPDHEGDNSDLEQAVHAQKFPRDRFGSIAVVNMAATWKPNAIISSVLKSRQEEFPDTVYVKDMNKALVSHWKMTDKNYDVVLFDKQGKVAFAKDGEFSKADSDALIEAIKKVIASP